MLLPTSVRALDGVTSFTKKQRNVWAEASHIGSLGLRHPAPGARIYNKHHGLQWLWS
jgi:hypothetical protein